MKLYFREVEDLDMPRVIELLQSISPFFPKSQNLREIFQKFDQQENISGWCGIGDGRVICFGVLIIEQKIRGGRLGHIEDIVVDEKYRQQGLGSKLINFLTELAWDSGCYKVSLSCRPHNKNFYLQNGFTDSGHSLQAFAPKVEKL